MRRFISGTLALLLVIDATAGWAAAEKKKGKKKKRSRNSSHHQPSAVDPSAPFADVPRGHWAYDAVLKATESGVLQGWDNKFHGGKVVNRYQMAVAVARMLDRVGVLKAGGKVITAQDIANLEALTIEFADELALLNVKVANLEEAIGAMKKDVDLIKADLKGTAGRSGISGTMQARMVFTDDIGQTWHPTRFTSAAAAVPFSNATAPLPGTAGTGAITRYRGAQTNGPDTSTAVVGGNPTGSAANPLRYESRDFLTVSNFSMNIDREVDRGVRFHGQFDVNAEGFQDAGANAGSAGVGSVAGTPAAGRGEQFASGTGEDIQINEAYVVWENWFKDGIGGRLGIWAVPMNFEANGPSRTYQWTITPSVANSKWESLRPVGLDIFQHTSNEQLVFYAGFFTPGDTAGGVNRSGALLSAPTGFNSYVTSGQAAGTALANIGAAGAMTDTLTNPANASQSAGAVALGGLGEGRFPTPISAAMTDAPRGVTGQTLSADDIGFYAMIGTQPTSKSHEGLTWNVAYYDRNGDLTGNQNDNLSATDWYAWQVAGKYKWEKFTVAGQYFDGTSKNHDSTTFVNTVDSRRLNTTPFANVGARDTESSSFMALVNWQATTKLDATFRYEAAEDKTGTASLEADIYTIGVNWRHSDRGLFQFEYILPTTRATSENGIKQTADVADDLVSVNYKLNW